MKPSIKHTVIALFVGGLTAASIAHAAEKPKHTIKEVMKEGFKGKTSAAARVGKGEGTHEDFKLLAELTKDLPLNEPERGEAASWKSKSADLAAAAKMLLDGKPGAQEAWKTAANCKACHTEHKPEDKK
jgi:hypothetical protein